MVINFSYEKEFEDLMTNLSQKYPKELFDIDGLGKNLDLSFFSKKFFGKKKVALSSIDANSNVDDPSVYSYTVELKKPFERLNSYYMLWKYIKKDHGLDYANECIEANLSGDIYINDFHGVGAGIAYCFNYSTYDIMTKGLSMVKKINCVPPKYLSSFKSQLEQFVTIASNNILGAVGLGDLFIVLSYYVKNMLKTQSDEHFHFASQQDCWEYLRSEITSFIYTINQPMRANQSPFTNVSIYDTEFLKKMCPSYLFPDGSTPDIELVLKIQELFIDIMNSEFERTPITFPVASLCLAKGEDGKIIDMGFLRHIATKYKKFAFASIYLDKTSVLSSCCRLRSDTDNRFFSSIGGSASTKIGSIGVCTINMTRLAINSQTEEDFLDGIEKFTIMSAIINNSKRKIIKKRIEDGNSELYKLGFIDLSKQYSTVGLNGFYESFKVYYPETKLEDYKVFGYNVTKRLNIINAIMDDKFKVPHNCELVPAENLAIKLCKKDKLLGIQNIYNIYSNQFIPLTEKADMLDRIKAQGFFDKYFSGGSALHLNIGERIENDEDIISLVELCAEFGVIFFSINYNFQQCAKGHMTIGRKTICDCGEPITDNYIKVVGFLTNTKNWAKERQEEDYPNREFF